MFQVSQTIWLSPVQQLGQEVVLDEAHLRQVADDGVDSVHVVDAVVAVDGPQDHREAEPGHQRAVPPQRGVQDLLRPGCRFRPRGFPSQAGWELEKGAGSAIRRASLAAYGLTPVGLCPSGGHCTSRTC